MSALGDLYKAGLAADGVNLELFSGGTLYGHKQYVSHSIQGEVTADSTGNVVFIAPKAGKILDVIGGVMENGSDSVDPLTMTFTVKKNGTAVCSTDPAIAKNAASDARVTTQASGTGITQAVVKSDGTEDFAAGDTISVDYDITRTTPDTEVTGPSVTLVFKLTEA